MEGLGTTVDCVLVNGMLREGDRIVICGLGGAIVSRIKALKTPMVCPFSVLVGVRWKGFAELRVRVLPWRSHCFSHQGAQDAHGAFLQCACRGTVEGLC